MGNSSTRKQFSKLLRKQAMNKSKKSEEIKNVREEKGPVQPNVELAKTSKLAFFRQYYTYQAFLEIYPKSVLPVEDCFSKAILYIMRWFKNRVGREVISERPELIFLENDYPEPDNYQEFDIEKISNINGFDFIDFETAYIKNREGWLVSLTEPDNGNERKDIEGRIFTTELFLYKMTGSIALGIRESCREPESNSEDATGYRPGFVRDIFFDKDLSITEFGLNREYAFADKPIILNGKSGDACQKFYDEVIDIDARQMPVLFVPGEFYKNNMTEVDKKTQSLLGFTHVVVWEGSCGKLFSQVMNDDELTDVANEGQLIFYRKTKASEYTSDYYEKDTDDMLNLIKTKAMKEPCRKHCDFGDYSFKPSWWEISKREESGEISLDSDEQINALEAEISKLNIQINDLNRDNDQLQRKNDSLLSENKKIEKDSFKLYSDFVKAKECIKDLEGKIKGYEERIRLAEVEKMQNEFIIKGILSTEKERNLPLLYIPADSSDIKNDIINWITDYYSDVIELHPNAIRSFKSDNRNMDWHRICMMIHYLAGYTKYRNDGGVTLNALAAREYDPEDSGYKIEPVSSGSGGSAKFFKDKYTITIKDSNGRSKSVLMDIHLKFGKGKDSEMIRIYFYYDSDRKKSIIGYFPGHLPIRDSAH